MPPSPADAGRSTRARRILAYLDEADLPELTLARREELQNEAAVRKQKRREAEAEETGPAW